MCNRILKALAAVCLCFSLPSPASSIPAGTYSLSGVTVNGSALTGDITLDNSGQATSASLAFTDPTYGSLTFTKIDSKGTSGNSPVADFAYISGSNGQVALYYLTALNGSGGITLCEQTSGCSQGSYLQVYSPNYKGNLAGGSLAAKQHNNAAAAQAVTPEPNPMILTGTALALISVFLLSRRRQPDASGTLAVPPRG